MIDTTAAKLRLIVIMALITPRFDWQRIVECSPHRLSSLYLK
jgi:hypothetical protein